jgi:transcription initiation factor IIE alpha subunit
MTGQERLYEEVHWLAYHYHWAEKDILEMTRSKRRRYLGLLRKELEREREHGGAT